jgi:methylenetetrahydrofolate dehydrogenase (NADP+)/methenyltetrahydrofolate cyclohydrolase
MAVDPKKDVDGFHPNSKFQPPIALAVLRILKEIYWKKSEARNPKSETNSNNQNPKFKNRFLSFEHSNFDIVSSFDIRISNFIAWLSSKKIIVIGKGETGGRPIIQLFKQMGIEPTVIDSKTSDPEQFTKKADIIISAVGKPGVIKPEMIKKNSILISIGLSNGKDGKLHGDYDEEEIKNIASFYTPTPGGVGPLNVAMLLENLIQAAENPK